MAFRSGFIAIIGRPNVGKSTFLNAILGEKVSIVSAKPQTTRNRIRGIKNLEDGQIVFIDTPGVHRARGALNRYMLREALSALKDVDGVLYMVEATRKADEGELFVIENLKTIKVPVILGINKIDLVKKESLLPLIDEYSKLFPFREIVPFSALTGDGLDRLMGVLSGVLPEGPRYFPEDMITDQPERFLVAEIIREKVFEFTRQEIPYSVAVVVEEFKEREEGGVLYISAVINVERDSQKGIIIGKGGSMLKRIGSSARKEVERILAAKVYLELYVRVKEKWTKDARALREFGYH